MKLNRLSVDMIIHWSRRKRVILDYDILRRMFTEADYRREGSISLDQLQAALTCNTGTFCVLKRSKLLQDSESLHAFSYLMELSIC